MTIANLPRYQSDRLSTRGQRAIILGASMSGLFAARVLADAYETVTIIEKDELPDTPDSRDGVPQGNHPHLLLKAGQQTIEDFFPGFCEKLLTAGGLLIDWTSDLYYYDEGGYIAGGPTRIPMYAASRPLFEIIVRRQVAQINEVEFRENCQFRSYLTNSDETAVTGIEMWDEAGSTERLTADLVVDATGRTSRTPAWLDTIGYQSPPVDEVEINVTYGTVQLSRPDDDRRMLFIPPSGSRTKGGGAFPIENNRWLVTLVGIHDDQPPSDPDSYIEYARDLPGPNLGQLLASHEWVNETIKQYPFASSIWRHYESLDRFPDNLLVIGDAVASFNPIYGQGMSVTAMEALQLHHLLADTPPSALALRFFDQNARLVRIAWRLSVGADFQFEQTQGPKPFGTDLFNWYVSRLIRSAHTDGVLANRFARVVMMDSSPTALIHPDTLYRVITPT